MRARLVIKDPLACYPTSYVSVVLMYHSANTVVCSWRSCSAHLLELGRADAHQQLMFPSDTDVEFLVVLGGQGMPALPLGFSSP